MIHMAEDFSDLNSSSLTDVRILMHTISKFKSIRIFKRNNLLKQYIFIIG